MKLKFRLLSILCIMSTSTNVFAYNNTKNNTDIRTYEIQTKMSIENVESNNFIITHDIQKEFDTLGVRYLRENIGDKDIDKVILNNKTVNIQYKYSDKNTFSDSRVIEIEDVTPSRFLFESPKPYDSDKLKEYLNVDNYLKTNDDKQLIKNISNSIIDDKRIPYVRAKLIYQYINTKFQYKFHYNSTFQQTIELGEGVCSDFAELFVILARYNNIPSRIVVGLRVKPENITNEYKNFSDRTHAWAEFYIKGYGWLMADPTMYIESDINNANRTVNWDGFVNDKRKDHILLAYDVWENIGVQQFGEYKPMYTRDEYYIRNASVIN